jgi:hypothetical protein
MLRHASSIRTLFLDFDGVLTGIEHIFRRSAYGFNEAAVKNLNWLCETADAQVVMITARLRLRPVGALQEQLREAGFTGAFHPEPAIETRLPFARTRGIARICQRHHIPPEKFVIVDNRDLKFTPEQRSRLVSPNSEKRLTEADCEKALSLFGIDPPSRTPIAEILAPADFSHTLGHSPPRFQE